MNVNYLSLLPLPAEIKVGVRDRKISMGHAKAIINIDKPETQTKVFYRIINEGLSVRNAEAIVREINYPVRKEKSKSDKKQLPKQYLSVRNSLNKWLDTKVDLKKNENGKGSITISFNSEDEFNRIAGLLTKEKN